MKYNTKLNMGIAGSILTLIIVVAIPIALIIAGVAAIVNISNNAAKCSSNGGS